MGVSLKKKSAVPRSASVSDNTLRSSIHNMTTPRSSSMSVAPSSSSSPSNSSSSTGHPTPDNSANCPGMVNSVMGINTSERGRTSQGSSQEDAHITIHESRTSNAQNETAVASCRCCGTLITYPASASRIRCAICSMVIILSSSSRHSGGNHNNNNNNNHSKGELSYVGLKKVLYAMKDEVPENYAMVEEYVCNGFGSFEILNRAFRKPGAKWRSLRSSGLDYVEIKKFFSLILRLKTQVPYYRLLCAACQALERPVKYSEPQDIYWLLILLELPSLSASLIPANKMFATKVKTVSYEILKRIIGLLGYSDRTTKKYMHNWFAQLSKEEFEKKIVLTNLYVSLILSKCLNNELKRSSGSTKQARSPSHLTTREDRVEEKEDDLSPASTTPSSSNSAVPRFWIFGSNGGSSQLNMIPKNLKIKLNQYGNDWHLRSAGRFSNILFLSNECAREDRVPTNLFYNTMADYVNVKQDFDGWQYACAFEQRRNSESQNNTSDTDTAATEPSIETVIEYLQNSNSSSLFGIGSASSPFSTKMKPSFTFCFFPFFLSLGAKILILEHEARKQMERKAEEAFLNSLQKRVPIDVYLRLKVRRDHLVHDSLRTILQKQSDLKKSLRVEFVNEPGIDAGGLKKEWFLLLTKELLMPASGLFTVIPESGLTWFSISTIENHEMYYLIGVILGLAIYNSTILDLRFPKYFYRKLIGKKNSNLEDYMEAFPQSGMNLKRLLQYDKSYDFDSLEIFFEINYQDIFGKVWTKELVPNGSKIKVDASNRVEYVFQYVNFFMNKVIADQFESFRNGFMTVIGGNAISLFNSDEIEQLLIGDDAGSSQEQFLNVDILKVISKYQGGINQDSELVQWLWGHVNTLNRARQKKLLMFITGTDRLPATGLHTLNFKITLLTGSNKRLPIAHTCFNELCLYNYPTKEELCAKLDVAIDESEGFGIK